MMNAENAMRSPTTKWTERNPKWFHRAAGPLLALAIVLSGTVILSTRPAGADQLSDARARASQIASKISQLQGQIETLGQQYNEAQFHLSQIQGQITATEKQIASAKAQVAADTANLRSSAIDAYISAGTQQTSNPLFATDQKTFAARNEYGHVASSKLAANVASLTVSQDLLATAKTQLQTQETSAQAQTNAASAALSQAHSLQAQLDGQLSGVNSQIRTLVAQQQAAAAAAAASTSSAGSYYHQNFPVPPASPGASGAVAAALSQRGVPYVWAASSPGVAFDCSGLTMWAWGRAGVSLPHYSGGQMAASAPVPWSGIQPGDLIFYGPDGSKHVAMYVGGGMMVEAPHTGAVVSVDPVRMDFVGIGRP